MSWDSQCLCSHSMSDRTEQADMVFNTCFICHSLSTADLTLCCCMCSFTAALLTKTVTIRLYGGMRHMVAMNTIIKHLLCQMYAFSGFVSK